MKIGDKVRCKNNRYAHAEMGGEYYVIGVGEMFMDLSLTKGGKSIRDPSFSPGCCYDMDDFELVEEKTFEVGKEVQG